MVNDPREIAGRNEPHWLYRLFDADGVLLYIGQTRRPAARFQIWFSRASREDRFAWLYTAVRAEWQRFPNHSAVVAAEKAAIEDGLPRHNNQHMPRRVAA